jgi:hypothetical protein
MEQPDISMKKSPLRVFAAVCIVVATIGLLIGILALGVNDQYAASRDFIEYWAAGQQLIQHANPYDPESILRIERAMGMRENEPQVSFSPPIALCLLLPLGLVSAKTGFIVWLLAIIGSLLLSIWLIWILNGRPDSAYHFCGYLFAPAVACLLLGQIGTFLLLGVVLFLYWYERRPWLAGAVLLPCVWKPHLFLPFFIVLFLWSVSRREYRIVAGFCVAALASYGLTLYFDPHVWSQYLQMMKSTSGRLHGYVPTLSVTLRFLIAPRAVWLQFVPITAACLWATWHFWTRRHRWSWLDQGSWVLLVSAACTPYAWFTDEAILLPAVLYGVYRAAQLGRSLMPIAVAGVAALIEVCAFGHIASTHYLWTVPAWMGWYIYAARSSAEEPEPTLSKAVAIQSE